MQTLTQRATLRLIRKRRPTQAGWFWIGYAVAFAALVILL